MLVNSGADAKPVAGRLSFIDNAVDPTTGTIRLKATFPNKDNRLWPAQFANVTVTLSTEPNAIVYRADLLRMDPNPGR